MKDLIDRQAAIDELMDWVEKEEKKSWSTFKGLFHWAGIKAMIECLPSAQPETNCSGIPNTSDFVSRKAVRAMVSAWAYDLMEQEDLNMALHDVDELPSVSAERQRGKKNEGYF